MTEVQGALEKEHTAPVWITLKDLRWVMGNSHVMDVISTGGGAEVGT